jgi:heme/copper-type cytochrome/quinol oxidase subunit 1
LGCYPYWWHSLFHYLGYFPHWFGNDLSGIVILEILSIDPEDIGTLYLIFGGFAGFIGSALSIIIRLELSSGGKVYLMGNYDQYNVVVTAHGIVMIFFLVLSTLISGF